MHLEKPKRTRARHCAVASGSAWTQKRGQKWQVIHVRAGHVFAWRYDELCPAYQHACCVGCGKPLHVLFPPNVQDEPRPLGAVGSSVWFGSLSSFDRYGASRGNARMLLTCIPAGQPAICPCSFASMTPSTSIQRLAAFQSLSDLAGTKVAPF